MIGFTIPLLVGLALQGLLGTLLLGPSATARPAIALSRASFTRQGATVTYTIAGVLGVLLLNPLWDAWHLWNPSSPTDDEKLARNLEEHELGTLLNLVLLSTVLGGIFVLRQLGLRTGQCDRMMVSEKALLRQVNGLQQEYTRLMEGSAQPAAPAAAGSKQQELEGRVQALDRERTSLLEKVAAAEKAQRSAEANLSALKTQSRGLEHEYDRLLVENEELQRRLQRGGLAPAPNSFGKKDE